MRPFVIFAISCAFFGDITNAFSPVQALIGASRITSRLGATDLAMSGSLHGENACFLPLKQLDQDYYAPRIIQVIILFGLKIDVSSIALSVLLSIHLSTLLKQNFV